MIRGKMMEKLAKIGCFIKRYFFDIAIIVFGTALTIVLALLTSNYAVLLGIAVTLFVELSLFSIRRETKSAVSQYLNDQSEKVLLNMQEQLQILAAISLQELLSKGENKEAVDIELRRLKKALSELKLGKRRIYSNEKLYEEQKQIIQKAQKTIRAVHVVTTIEDLYRWDPLRMSKESSFYKVLYSAFQQMKRGIHKRQRIIILPKWGVEEIKCKHEVICQKPDSELSNEEKSLKQYYEVIQSVLADQNQLQFQIRFITATEAIKVGIPIYDCLIGDTKYGFEFSKSDSADVQAYAIDSEDYIKQQVQNFDDLWKHAVSW